MQIPAILGDLVQPHLLMNRSASCRGTFTPGDLRQLTFISMTSSHTFENTSKHCKSTIDQFLCASRNLVHFKSCYIAHDLPSNTSDHSPLVAEISSTVQHCPRSKKTSHASYNCRKLSQREIQETYSVNLREKLNVTHQQLKNTYRLFVLPCRRPARKQSHLRHSSDTKGKDGTPQLMLPIDAPKLLGNGGNGPVDLVTQPTLSGSHTLKQT